jgi:hypothetical protein
MGNERTGGDGGGSHVPGARRKGLLRTALLVAVVVLGLVGLCVRLPVPLPTDVQRIEVDALNDRSQMKTHHFITDPGQVGRVRDFVEARSGFPWWQPPDTFPTPQCSLVFFGEHSSTTTWVGAGWLGTSTGTSGGNRLKNLPVAELDQLEELAGLPRGVCTCTTWPCAGRVHAADDAGVTTSSEAGMPPGRDP